MGYGAHMGIPGVDDAMRRLLERGRSRVASDEGDHARLWDALIGASEGGKRFRPALVIAAHDAFEGTRGPAALEIGAAIELLHTAFVIHDDVIDGDDVRRGRPNVSGTFCTDAVAGGAAHEEGVVLGRAAGILAGDLALAASIRAVAMCGAPVEVTHRLLDLFDAALHTTSAGELTDVRLSLSTGSASLAESLSMVEQKTSYYSFALPLQAGALLAQADDQSVALLGEVGRLLGVAFQLADDLLGVFGEPSVTGKSSTNDLRSNKQTPLLAHARATAEWDSIRGYVGRDLSGDELGEVRELLTASGSRRFVEDLATDHHAKARSIVDGMGLPIDLLAAARIDPGYGADPSSAPEATEAAASEATDASATSPSAEAAA